MKRVELFPFRSEEVKAVGRYREGHVGNDHAPLPSEEGTTLKGRRTFPWKPKPDSSPDSLNCAEFARQRHGEEPPRIQGASGSTGGSMLATTSPNLRSS